MELSRGSVLPASDAIGSGFDRAALARVWPLFALIRRALTRAHLAAMR